MFLVIFSVWWALTLIRTGAWHPLPNLNGCLGTRGTRSNDGPVYKKFNGPFVSDDICRQVCEIFRCTEMTT